MNYQNIIKLISRLEKEKILYFSHYLFKKFPSSEIYLVGGAVRDGFLNKLNEKDYDFVVKGIKIQDLEKTLKNMGIVNLVGKTFGVFKFLPKNIKLKEPLDIALPRSEDAFNTGGYKDVKIKTNYKMPIEKDLSRRDFTMNSLEWDIKKKELIDPLYGLRDIEKKIIKTAGNPEKRFQEDYSRILRALRFSCQLNFKIEKNTWKAVKKLMPEINNQKNREWIMPREVLAQELLKTFYFNPVLAFDLYDQSHAFQTLMPEILKMKECPQPKNFHSEGDVWTHTRLALEKLNSEKYKKQFDNEKPSPELILGILFHDIGKPFTIKTPQKDKTDRIRFNEHDLKGAEITKKICERLRLSSASSFEINPERIAWLVRNHMLTIHGKAEKMKNSTIEKYFFNKQYNGQDLLKLSLVDMLATIPEKEKLSSHDFKTILSRIDQLKKMGNKKEPPPPLLNGYQIMKKFKLKPGPQIGKLLSLLREEQLAGRVKKKKEAYQFLKNELNL